LSIGPLLTNVSNTYREFPNLSPPFLAQDCSLPPLIGIPLAFIGIVAPFLMGLATARIVRSTNCWDDVSAGLTTALTSSLAAYVFSIGWAVTLALVVVPSISDLTLLGTSTRTPVSPAAAPSDPLAERYPDLQGIPADKRGLHFFAKIMSDQVVGSAYGTWLGIGLALSSVGLLGFCGTIAGGWLLRRGGSSLSIVIGYFELTVSISLAFGRLISIPFGLTDSMSGIGAGCLVACTGVVVAGVIGRWRWLLRVAAALAWVMAQAGAGFDSRHSLPVTLTGYLSYGILAALLFRQWSFSHRLPTGVPA
jgi:hypothetical protein